MKICRSIQEKLVAAEPLTSAEKNHLSRCKECLEIMRLDDLLHEVGRSEPPAPLPAYRPAQAFKPFLAGALAALALISMLLFWPKSIDYHRAADRLASLWEEVEQVTEIADSMADIRETSGWLLLELENFDPSADDSYWP